jgi:hypothetical protein
MLGKYEMERVSGVLGQKEECAVISLDIGSEIW